MLRIRHTGFIADFPDRSRTRATRYRVAIGRLLARSKLAKF